MDCKKCGSPYYRTAVCRECGFVPLHEDRYEQIRIVIMDLLNELPKARQESYINRLKEMGVL